MLVTRASKYNSLKEATIELSENSLPLAQEDKNIKNELQEVIDNYHAINIDIEDFFKKLKLKTRTQKIKLRVNATYYLTTSLLAINSARNAPHTYVALLRTLLQSPYYTCTLPEVVIRAIALEGTVGALEAYGITTPFFLFLALVNLPLEIMMWLHDKIEYYYKHQQINELLHLLELKTNTTADLTKTAKTKLQKVTSAIKENFNEFLDLDKLATERNYLTTFSKLQLNAIMDEIQKSGISEKTLVALKNKFTRLDNFLEDLQAYTTQLNKWLLVCAIPFAVCGLIKMYIQSKILEKQINCHLSTVTFDTCKVEGQFLMMTLQIYPWLGISFLYYSMLALAVSAYLALRPFSSTEHFRNYFLNTIHKRFVQLFRLRDEDGTYEKLFYEIFSLITMPAAISYSFFSSMQLGERYSKLAKCGTTLEILNSIRTNTRIPTHACTRAQVGLWTSGVVANFEVGHFWVFRFTTQIVSSLVAKIAKTRAYFKNPLTLHKAEEYVKKFKAINDTSIRNMVIAAAAVAVIQIYYVARYASDVAKEDLYVDMDIDDFDLGNTNITALINNPVISYFFNETNILINEISQANSTWLPKILNKDNVTLAILSGEFLKFLSDLSHIGNSTFTALLHKVCPYDDLLTKIPNNFTAITATNHSLPVVVTPPFNFLKDENGTITEVTFYLAKRCPQQNIISVFWSFLTGTDIDCDRLLIYRLAMTFMSIFWGNESVGGGGTLALSIFTLLSLWVINDLCYKKSHAGKDNNANPPQISGNDYHPLREERDVLAQKNKYCPRLSLFGTNPLPQHELINQRRISLDHS